MSGTANLKPWPKGVSGNPGGRPKKKPITEELERLLGEQSPNGQSWASVIAQALLHEASKGDVRAISELVNRVEGKPFQSMALNVGGPANSFDSICKQISELSDEELENARQQLEAEDGLSPN